MSNGRIPWNKNLTKETSPILAIVSKKVSAALTGKPLTEEHIRAVKQGIVKAGGIWNKGLSKETDPRVARQGNYNAKQMQDIVPARKVLLSLYNDPNWHKRISRTHKRMWQDPYYANKQVKLIRKGNLTKPNKTEFRLQTFLDKYFPNTWKYVSDGSLVIGRKCPDFANLNGKKELIEFFGDYWHSEEITRRCKEDEEEYRIRRFAKFGYKTLIIWERELDDEKSLIEKIRTNYG